MQPQTAALRQGTEFGNRVDHTVRKARRRAHQHHGVLVDQSLHGRDVSAKVRPHWGAPDLQVHESGGLVEGRVQRLRCHDVAAQTWLAALLTRPVTAGLDRLDDAFGAAGGHEAAAGFGRVEQIQRHVHHLLLHAAHAVEGPLGAQRVLGEVLEEGLTADLVGLVIALEDEQRRPAMRPVDVTRLEAAQIRQDLLARTALRRHLGPHGNHPPFV